MTDHKNEDAPKRQAIRAQIDENIEDFRLTIVIAFRDLLAQLKARDGDRDKGADKDATDKDGLS